VKRTSSRKFRKSVESRSARRANTLLPALVAVGGGLAVSPALGLELGNVKVHSTLGQPLRASIAYALGPNEQVSDTCVALHPGRSADGMPTINRARIRVADGVITLAGNTAISEPMLTMRVNVDCAYTARLSREYLLFLEPAGSAVASVPAPVPADEPAKRRESAATVRRPETTRPRANSSRSTTAPISTSGRYQVQRGDSLSEIAARIENRPVGLWAAAEAIFAANPDAFINNDPNLLKAGSWLDLPDFGTTQAVTTVQRSNAPGQESSQRTAPGSASSIASGSASMPTEEAAGTPPAAAKAPANETEIETSAPVGEFSAAAPGEADNPFVVIGAEDPVDAIVIPDTNFEIPASSSLPNVPTAVIRTPVAESSSVNWLFWLVGSGIGLLVILLLFGRSLSKGYDLAPAPARRRTDIDPGAADLAQEIDFDLSNESPTEENLVLDADLAIGSGLEAGEIDVAQDFGFAATTNIDIELPEDTAHEAEITATDLIAPVLAERGTILESEVLPDDEDYDMSVILDATKMPMPEDATAKNLRAVAVDTGDDTLIKSDYSVSHGVDIELLEQDYEDELTATQALNQEIAKAAEELARQAGNPTADDTDVHSVAGMSTVEMSQLSAENDDDCDTITKQLLVEDKTVEMPGHDNDKTVEMPRDDNDATVEMAIKPGKVGSKAG